MRFETHALGRAFHAARVTFRPRAMGSTPHGHADFYELMLIIAGHGEHRLATGIRELRAGDLVLVRPSDQHAMRGSPQSGMSLINVAFPATAWRSFTELAQVDAGGDWDRCREPPWFRLCGSDAEEASAACNAVLSAFHGVPSMLDLVRFWTDVVELLRPPALADMGEATARPDWLVRAASAMRREENLRGGTSRLRGLANVSPAHLSRSMRRYYGQTPTRFIAELRLELAATLLASTALTITEVTYRCGYASPSYFTRCFHAAHGVSPREFRERAQQAFVP